MGWPTPTKFDGGFTTTNAHTYTSTANLNFVANRLYVAFFGCTRSGGGQTIGVPTGTAAAWTSIVNTATYGVASTRQLGVSWYIPSANETKTLTWDPTPDAANQNGQWVIFEISSNFNTSNPIAQNKAATAATTTSLTVTLTNAPAAGNLSISGFDIIDNTLSITARTNWTGLANNQGTGTASDSGDILGQYKTALNAEQSASGSSGATNVSWGGIHLELAAVAGGSTTTPGSGLEKYVGAAPSELINIVRLPGTGSEVYSGLASKVVGGQVVKPSSGSEVYSGLSSKVIGGTVRLPGSGTEIYSGLAPIPNVKKSTSPGAGLEQYVGLAPSPSVVSGKVTKPGAGTEVYSGLASKIIGGQIVKPGSGVEAYIGLSPIANLKLSTGPGTGLEKYVGQASTVLVAASFTVSPGFGNIVYSGLIPSIVRTVTAATTAATGAGGGEIYYYFCPDYEELERKRRRSKHPEFVKEAAREALSNTRIGESEQEVQRIARKKIKILFDELNLVVKKNDKQLLELEVQCMLFETQRKNIELSQAIEQDDEEAMMFL